MASHELALLLGFRSVTELNSLPYDELVNWQEFFRRRPAGWREDNRAAIIAMSFAGKGVKPEDLFYSLKVIKQEEAARKKETEDWSVKFFRKFTPKMTDKATAQRLLQDEDADDKAQSFGGSR